MKNNIVVDNYFMDNFVRKSKLGYYKIVDGNVSIEMNYRIYNGRYMLNGITTVTNQTSMIKCTQVHELMEAIARLSDGIGA